MLVNWPPWSLPLMYVSPFRAFVNAELFDIEDPSVTTGACVPQWVVEAQGSRSKELEARTDARELRVGAAYRRFGRIGPLCHTRRVMP